jgi:prepilin-type N-terminal cleavage/methylation domain-containing protein
MRRTNTNYRGFTIIEVAIVIVILGILYAIAVPSYHEYLSSRQVHEGMRLIEGWQSAIGAYRAKNGAWPSSTVTKEGLVPLISGRYAGTVNIGDNGVIEILFNGPEATSPIQGKELDIAPYADGAGNVIWRCAKSSTLEYRFWPTSCP